MKYYLIPKKGNCMMITEKKESKMEDLLVDLTFLIFFQVEINNLGQKKESLSLFPYKLLLQIYSLVEWSKFQ